MSVMPSLTDLQNLGRELRARRMALGETSLRKFGTNIGVSHQHLSHIENAYVHPKRGLVVPSDDVLKKMAAGYQVPLSRLHGLLGRLPDLPVPVFKHPEAQRLAERFDRLPKRLQETTLEVFASIERLAKQVDGTNE
jgi:transcriptional regulator with XRE-family HTH domain